MTKKPWILIGIAIVLILSALVLTKWELTKYYEESLKDLDKEPEYEGAEPGTEAQGAEAQGSEPGTEIK